MPSFAGHPTVVDIARSTGASTSNVPLVLKHNDKVQPEVRKNVRRVVEQLAHDDDHDTRHLRRRSLDVVGLIISDLTNPLLAELAAGVERGLHRAGTMPLLITTGESPIRQAQAMQALRERGASGFIICPTLDTDRAVVCDAEDARLPVVSVMRRFPGARASYVGPDNHRGAESATAHLIASGHRCIAFLGGHHGTVVREERLEGYATAMRAAGLPVDPAVVIESAPSREGGLAALDRILALRYQPTAALCFNDVVAFGVLRGLPHHGLEAGRELAIVGFGDVHDAQHAVPALTTVAIDLLALGERAAQMLVERIDNPGIEPAEYHCRTRLVVRASCSSAYGKSSGGATPRRWAAGVLPASG